MTSRRFPRELVDLDGDVLAYSLFNGGCVSYALRSMYARLVRVKHLDNKLRV